MSTDWCLIGTRPNQTDQCLKLLTTVTGQGGEISKGFSFGWKWTSRKWKSPRIGAKNELHVAVNGDELDRAIPQDMDQNWCWEMLRQDGKHGATTSYFVSILQQWGRNLTSQDCWAAITQTYGVHTAPLESLSNAPRKPMSECSNASILMSKAQTRASSPYSVHYVTELQAYMLLETTKGRTLSSSGTVTQWTAIPDIVKSYFINSLKIWNLIWGNSSLTNY